MNRVKPFYDATIKLIQLLENEQLERDEKITQSEKYLIEREGLMKEIKPPFTHEEEQIGKQLLSLNQKLQRLLEQEKVLIQHDLLLIKKQKESNKKYTNPYQSLAAAEGGFYDKRK